MFLQLYIAKVPIGSGSGYGSSEKFPDPDPTKKVWIRNPALVFCIPTRTCCAVCSSMTEGLYQKIFDLWLFHPTVSLEQMNTVPTIEVYRFFDGTIRYLIDTGLRIRSIFGQIRIRIQQIRIFKTGSGSGSYWHLPRINSKI